MRRPDVEQNSCACGFPPDRRQGRFVAPGRFPGRRAQRCVAGIAGRRQRNARSTIAKLLDWHAVPVINENDTVATNEIRYGDNDRLAARVATMASADLLVLLSDVDGLYDAPPASGQARHVPLVERITP